MRLFARIFLSFWLMIVTLIVITTAFALAIFSLLPPYRPGVLPIHPMHTCALAAMDVYARSGPPGLAQYLGRSRTSCSGGIVLNLRSPTQLADLGPNLATVENPAGQQSPENASVTVRTLPFSTTLAIPGEAGTQAPGFVLLIRTPYVFFLNSPRSLRATMMLVLSRLALLVGVSGLCCYPLTLYLVKPIIQLGQTAEQFGKGELSTRIGGPLIIRRDELGDLSRKFNDMASEIESLVTRYKHFLAHASHELGSPLTRVNIALGLARRKTDPALHPELNRIGHETKRLNTLVQELLLLARLESGNELNRQAVLFDVAQVVEEACEDATFEALQIGKTVLVERNEVFQVSGHPALLRRAVDNILRNGLRFAREAGTVRIKASYNTPKRLGTISIHDDGPGIAVGNEELIFEPFVTLSNNVTGFNEGSGLGLAIARQAVLANGGKISARGSRGEGLTVTIELPAASRAVELPHRSSDTSTFV